MDGVKKCYQVICGFISPD